ncbi:hypothetical protein MCOR25_010658 [Pyricularia grisea]|uniref:Uncharacterized protein n=1 Tax=Pyricularia grisea TaxID=148305 RepID=A0A6P8BMD5_PYRGI|nr:uncharacterized protein PgNI_00675 [Pyricularia grisea]KAI6349476.1 hypothetical protein MCOR25_010658 [Pyricularia grisea]TLD17854.1 hypothetical protein PgNI_00675 [Pyricularia grisea]
MPANPTNSPFHPFNSADAWHAANIKRLAIGCGLGAIKDQEIPSINLRVCQVCDHIFEATNLLTASLDERRYTCWAPECISRFRDYYIQWPELRSSVVGGFRAADVSPRVAVLVRHKHEEHLGLAEELVRKLAEAEGGGAGAAGSGPNEPQQRDAATVLRNAWQRSRQLDPANN